MRISHRYKFIFFAYPKAGSETVRHVLDPFSDVRGIPMWEMDGTFPYYTHIRPVEVRALFAEEGRDFDSYFKFSFVRNPWARAVSLYRMIYGRGSPRKRLVAKVRGGHVSPRGFRRWVRTIETDGPGAGGPSNQRWQVYGAYSVRAYFGDGEGNELVDRLMRLEDIEEELPRTLDELGLPIGEGIDIPRLNTWSSEPYQAFYDRATTEYVGELYREEIERFGYSFDE